MNLNCLGVGGLNPSLVFDPHFRAQPGWAPTSDAHPEMQLSRQGAQMGRVEEAQPLSMDLHTSETSAIALDSVSYTFPSRRIN